MFSVVRRVLARAEGVAEFAQVNELRDLRFAHDQLRAALDLGVVIFEAERDRVARIVCPLDDLDQLAADETHDTHSDVSS